MKNTGSDAVKVKVKKNNDIIKTLVNTGIPVMGHIGFTTI